MSVWLYRWWQQRFTGPGKTALVIVVSLALLGVVSSWHGTSIPIMLCSVAFAVSWLFTLRAPHVEATWTFPSSWVEGSEFRMRITLHNPGIKVIHDVGAWLFWEENWLIPVGEPLCVPDLAPGETIQLEMTVRALRRGPCYLRGPVSYHVHALGLMRSRMQMAKPSVLGIRPLAREFECKAFLVEGLAGREFARILQPVSRRSDVLLGLREYREGDELRDLHHKAWARLGKPFVREYGNDRNAGIIVVLETYCESFFERAGLEPLLRLTAGLVIWLSGHNALGRFFINDQELSLESPQRAQETILDALGQIPRTLWWSWPKPASWQPEARPMGPVLALGCSRMRANQFRQKIFAASDALIEKRIYVENPVALYPLGIIDTESRLLCVVEDGDGF